MHRLNEGEPVEPLDLAAAEAAERLDVLAADTRAAKAQRDADERDAE